MGVPGESRTESRSLVLLAGIAAVLFVGLLAAVPALEAAGVSSARSVRWAFAPVCHQVPSRSLWLLGSPLPVCARCLGLYTGGAAGLLLAAALPARSRLRPRWLLLAAAPTMLDALARLAGWRGLENMPRLLLAAILGAVAGAFLAQGLADLQWTPRMPGRPGLPPVLRAGAAVRSLENADG